MFREPASSDVPAYAILSHTWDKEEVSFQDMEADAGMSKAGRKKIEFCAKQAAANGLEYFWIDTCCIDKKNAVELSAAINSMFQWYQNSVRCYVYLSDVSIQGEGQDGTLTTQHGKPHSRRVDGLLGAGRSKSLLRRHTSTSLVLMESDLATSCR